MPAGQRLSVSLHRFRRRPDGVHQPFELGLRNPSDAALRFLIAAALRRHRHRPVITRSQPAIRLASFISGARTYYYRFPVSGFRFPENGSRKAGRFVVSSIRLLEKTKRPNDQTTKRPNDQTTKTPGIQCQKPRARSTANARPIRPAFTPPAA